MPIEDDTFFYSITTYSLAGRLNFYRESDNLIYKVDFDDFNYSIQDLIDMNINAWLIMDSLQSRVLEEGDLSNDAQQELYLTSRFDVSDNFDVNNFKYYYNKLRSTLAAGESKLLVMP